MPAPTTKKQMSFKVATLAVGDEVLLGETLNSNASWLAQQMQQHGEWQVTGHSVVGDDREDIVDAVTCAMQHGVDLLVLTGGLGPTPDDLTVASLASAWACPLKQDAEVIASLQRRFAHRGLSLPPSNLKQADVPEGAIVLMNPVGTAPALLWPRSDETTGHRILLLLLPGVPKEMKTLWPLALELIQQRQLLPLLPKASTQKPKRQANAWFYGLGESHLLEALAPWLKETSLLVAPYVNEDGAVRLRLQERGLLGEAPEVNAFAEAELAFKRYAPRAFLMVEEASKELPVLRLELLVAEALKQKGFTLSVAESCTGGLLSSKLTDVAGSSAYTQQNFVVYSEQAKQACLGVPKALLEREGAVSAAVVQAMAKGLLEKTNADLTLATTGFANPQGIEGETPGLLYIALADRRQQLGFCVRYQGADFWDRRTMKARFVYEALYLLWSHLQTPAGEVCVLALPRQVFKFAW